MLLLLRGVTTHFSVIEVRFKWKWLWPGKKSWRSGDRNGDGAEPKKITKIAFWLYFRRFWKCFFLLQVNSVILNCFLDKTIRIQVGDYNGNFRFCLYLYNRNRCAVFFKTGIGFDLKVTESERKSKYVVSNFCWALFLIWCAICGSFQLCSSSSGGVVGILSWGTARFHFQLDFTVECVSGYFQLGLLHLYLITAQR